MAITITYRFQGVDVSASAPNIDLLQWDSDDPLFDAHTTTMDVVWNGIQFHYNPAYVGPSPSLVYFSAYRIDATYTSGAITGGSLVMHTAAGDVVATANPNVGGIISQMASGGSNPFSGAIPDLAWASGLVGPVTELTLDAAATMALGGRGIVIAVPTVGQWALQKLSVRPRSEEHM